MTGNNNRQSTVAPSGRHSHNPAAKSARGDDTSSHSAVHARLPTDGIAPSGSTSANSDVGNAQKSAIG